MNKEEIFIHPSAVVHPNASLGKGVYIGPFCVIEEEVVIGAYSRLHSHIVIRSGSFIGDENQFYCGCVIGSEPQDLKFKGEKSYVEIGNKNIFREYVTVHRGCEKKTKTIIGNECNFFAYSHVGHNCILKNHIVLTNSAALSGYVHVHDNVLIGGLTGVHQFVTLGRSSMIGGLSKITRDVPPFMLVNGQDQKIYGLNTVGLKRLNFSKELRDSLSKAAKIMFHSGLPLAKAIERIEKMQMSTELNELLIYAKGIYNGKFGRARQP